MQLSEAALYIFVEGVSDKYAYSRLADHECKDRRVDYRVVSAEEIGVGGGGKNVLLGFFDYLRRLGSLVDNFKGRTTVSIFFLDKDIDDLLRTKRRSAHVVYTQHYDIEGYYFIHGDICTAVAASVSLDIGSVRARISDYSSWRRQAASCWKEWVKLCIWSRVCPNGTMSYYGRPASQVHDRAYGPLTADLYANHLEQLSVASGLPAAEFEACFARLSKRIDRLFSKGEHDQVFKGRWYLPFLLEDIKAIAGSRLFNRNRNGLESRLVSSLQSTINFGEAWAEHFKVPLRAVLISANANCN